MATISIELAREPRDFDAAQALCREWLDWHWQHYPSDWPKGSDHPMDPDRFEATVRDIETDHAREGANVIIARLDGDPVGCVMYQEAAPGVTEFNRMFVSEGGRGHGIGRKMLDRMLEAMTRDGYRKVFFSSAAFLTHARAMYEAAGFRGIPHPDGFPDEWRDKVYFMERQLAP